MTCSEMQAISSQRQVDNKDYITKLNTDMANVYDPESMETEELRMEEMRQAIMEAQKQMD